MVVLGQIDFDALNLLLKAKSKDVVAKLVSDAFDKRNRKVNAETFISITDVLDCDSTEAGQLFSSLIMLVKNCLYEGLGDRQSIASIFPGTFHKNLKDLLSKIIVENLTGWKEQAMTTQVSLPKLADFDWRVDVKTSSDAITRMSVPTCLLQLKIQENACKDNLLPELKCLNVELSKRH